MHASTAQFSRGRITALVLIALVALGLGYLHFSGGSDAVSVPAGAHEGQLTMEPCTFDNNAAECGTIYVRENRHDPDSRLIALPVKRIPARSAKGGAPVFGLLGGPGHSNFDFTAMTRFAGDRDVVLVGYRGVDGSVSLDCPEVVDSRESSRDWLKASSLRADADAMRACATRLSEDGIDLGGYTLPQRVDDLELVRQRLGYGPIDLVSESFGTRIALIYAWRYPKSIHRSVMVGVNPPGHFLWDAKTSGEQLRRYAALCARDGSCSARTDDLAASFSSAYDRMPSRWGFLPIKEGNVRVAALFGLFNATTDGGGPLAAPITLDSFLSADEGDASGLWFLSTAVQLIYPRVQVMGDVAAMGQADDPYATQFFASPEGRATALGNDATKFVWSGGGLVDAWPSNRDDRLYARTRRSDVETLLVGGALDFSTPPQVVKRDLLPYLPNGQQVVLRNLGHTEDFWAVEKPASVRLVTTYLDTGRIDTSLYATKPIDFSPSLTHTTLAKVVLGALLAFATVMLLAVVWLGVRLLRGKEFGRKGSVAVRSLLPLVLGLSGWFAGVLIVLIAFPTVPLTSAGLAVVAVAPPVALAIYAGWFRPGGHQAIAALVVLGAAVIGTWLGFHVPDLPIVGVSTAIVGAVLAANLALIVFDVTVPEAATAAEREVPTAKTMPGAA